MIEFAIAFKNQENAQPPPPAFIESLRKLSADYGFTVFKLSAHSDKIMLFLDYSAESIPLKAFNNFADDLIAIANSYGYNDQFICATEG